MVESVETVVIGAGAVGLAVARSLARAGRDVVVIERNGAIGQETSSRNSEVIHAGIYYLPGSLKAKLCVEGKAMLYRYLEERRIDYMRCGKVIVATAQSQIPELENIKARARDAGVNDLRDLSQEEVAAIEPEVACVSGIFSPSTGIFDTHSYMLSLQGDVEVHGGVIAFRTDVKAIIRNGDRFELELAPDGSRLRTSVLINSAGLHAPAVARSFDGFADKYVPEQRYAIGHYYGYAGRPPFSHLVYPVPEPGGLGVHVTLDLAGQVRFGPDVRWIDEISYIFDDSRRAEFEAAIRQYYPGLDAARLTEGYTGIRPKIGGPNDPASDFVISGPEHHGIPGLVNLFGIESPGLTASLAIAEETTRRLV